MKRFIIITAALVLLVLFTQVTVIRQIRFKDVTKKAGLIDPLKGMMGHGAAWGDVNGDGFPDLFYATFTDRPDSIYNERGHINGPEPNKLLINQGNGKFKEIIDSPIRIYGRCSGAVFVDFDNDGDLDLVVSHQSYEGTKNQKPNNFFFENDGKGNFKDITKTSNLNFGWPFLGRNTFVLDFDGDGLLDLLMQEDYAREDVSGGNSRLMKNMGDLKFKDVTEEAGLPNGYREGLYGLGGFVGDINNDGWPDIFFAHSCRMFLNNADGTFREKEYNLIDKKYTASAKDNPNWTCGADMGDFNNDGRMDIVIGDHFLKEGNHYIHVFLNEGNDANNDPILRNITKEANVINPGGKAIHVQIQDIDNDGLMDIMTSNCSSFIYKNKGVKDGIPIFDFPVNSGYKGGIGYWAGGPLVDYDRDGRLDFFGPEWEPSVPSPLLKNITKRAKNYIDIKLDLKNSLNRNGIGAKVEIFKKGQIGEKSGLLGTYIISVSNGYSSGYEAIAHFGLPEDKFVDIRVTMPCEGKVYSATSIKRNQLFCFTE